MTDKKNKGLQDDLVTCPRCKGRGKIVCQRDEDDVYGHEQTCPVCGGRGKIKPTGRPPKRPRRSRYSPIPSKPKSGGGGRRRPPRALLLPPGTPVSPWPQGDGVPIPTPESLHRRPKEPELAIPETPDTPATYGETVLDSGDDITITLGPEFGPDLTLDEDASRANYREPRPLHETRAFADMEFPADSEEVFDRLFERHHLTGDFSLADGDDGVYELGRPDDQTPIDLDGLPFDRSVDDSLAWADPPGAGLSSEIPGGGPDTTGTIDTDVIGARDPLDPPIDYDPIGFDIDTDVIGPEPL